MTSPTIITATLFGALLAAACLHRYRQMRVFPLGFGWSQLSPDTRYIAHATELEDVSFFGRHTWSYEFQIVDCAARCPVVTQHTPRVRQPGAEDFMSQVRIQWTSDSQRVRVSVGEHTLWEKEIAETA